MTADHLDLDALAQISQRLPLPEDMHTILKLAQPKGQVNQLSASWMRPSTQPSTQPGEAELSYKVKGAVSNLQWLQSAHAPEPFQRLPGVSGADIEFDLSQQGGKAQIAIKQGGVTLPEGLEEAKIPISQAATNISWQIKPADKKSAATQEPEISVFKQGRATNAGNDRI